MDEYRHHGIFKTNFLSFFLPYLCEVYPVTILICSYVEVENIRVIWNRVGPRRRVFSLNLA